MYSDIFAQRCIIFIQVQQLNIPQAVGTMIGAYTKQIQTFLSLKNTLLEHLLEHLYMFLNQGG